MKTMRALAAMLLSILACACSSTKTEGINVVSMRDDRPEVVDARGWLNVKTLQLQDSQVAPEADDLVLRGTMRGWRFYGADRVEGTISEPPKKATVVPATLVINDRSIRFAGDPGTEGGPTLGYAESYLRGHYDTATKLFYPSHLDVMHTTPGGR